MVEIGEFIQYFVLLILSLEVFPRRGRRIDLKAQTIFLSFVFAIQLVTLFLRLYFHDIQASIIFIIITLILGAKLIFNIRKLHSARQLGSHLGGEL